MKFEQYQEEDGKNIINITVETKDSEELKKDAENFIHGGETPTHEEAPEVKSESKEVMAESKTEIVNPEENKYKNYNYLLIFGIVVTFALLVVLVYFYTRGY